MTEPLVLRRQSDRRDPIDVLAASSVTGGGGRVGLDAVLADLNRAAKPVRVPAPAADYGFRWDLGDMLTQTWWPQGITTSADASDVDDIGGRRVVVVAWYAKKWAGVSKGVRLSFVDVSDPAAPRYRHVLLVEPGAARGMKAVLVHAGGILWYGPSLLVADTRGGIRVFDLDDVCRIADEGGFLGYRYVLPQRTAYLAEHGDDEPFRFSFISLDRTGAEHQLVAGEYGRDGQTTRLTRFALDAGRLGLAFESDDVARPLEMLLDGRVRMQGATIVEGTWYVTAARGPVQHGALYTRRRGEDFVEHPGVLSAGPEDLTYWPRHDRLWTCSEWPSRRFVYAMPRRQFD